MFVRPITTSQCRHVQAVASAVAAPVSSVYRLFSCGHKATNRLPLPPMLLPPALLLVSCFAVSLVSAGSGFPPLQHSNCTLADGVVASTAGALTNASYVVLPFAIAPPNAEKVLKRDKRYLLFTGASVVKGIFGISAPIETSDKVNWRSLNMAYNFQAQYVPIATVSFPWTRFGRKLERSKAQFDKDGSYANDNTRNYVYKAYEIMMEARGVNGKQCLFRAICEAAQEPIQQGGVFEEILHLFLTPRDEDADSEYLDPKLAGERGADCMSLYAKCPMGSGLLDTISYFRNE